jgi:hypothetical protein
MHADDIVSKRMDGRDASFVRVRELLYYQMFSKLIYLRLFLNSMSNLLIETSAIETFPKWLSLKRSSGNFGTSSSSPFLKARHLKRRSLKMFVLRLFGKFMPLFPTLKGRRFHFTRNLGPWTPQISNRSNVLSAALKTGENGGWLTAVARWHMRYLLRWISRWRHDRVSELRSISFALRVAQCWLQRCMVNCILFGTTVCHRHTGRDHPLFYQNHAMKRPFLYPRALLR